MRIFGFEITRAKALPAATPTMPASSNSGWWPIIREPFTGAWQRNMELRGENLLSYHAVYACVTLISTDIAKLRVRLVQNDGDDIWTRVDESSPYWRVLIKQNRYQTRIQFFEQWLTSKLLHGNTYVLKDRDERGIVNRLYVLDPTRVKPLVAPDGSVFYDLSRRSADLIGDSLPENVRVPASEIIHDRMVPLYHPLCGVSPVIAYGLAAAQGLNILDNSSTFFANGSRPGGILSAPANIPDETAQRLKRYWEENYTGDNAGKVAVLGDGLKYESMSIAPVDAQLIEQLKWSAEVVCSAFHVPPYMIGVGPPPNYNNIEALSQMYYSQCLQQLIESIEILLDEGLALPRIDGSQYGTEFDLAGLLRMDTATKVKAAGDAINAGFLKPNEARAMFDLKPVPGGDTPYLQQQNFSLEALNKRDTSEDPFGQAPAPPPPDGGDQQEPEPEQEDDSDARAFVDILLTRAQRHALTASNS